MKESRSEASLPIEKVDTIHKDCLSGRFDDVVSTLLKPNTDAFITRFFKQKTNHVTTQSGINIDLGEMRFFDLAKTDVKTVITENIHGHQQVTFDGYRGVEFDHGGDAGKFYVDFDAHMKIFSREAASVSADEFDYGLKFVTQIDEGAELSNVLDKAATWGAISPGDIYSEEDAEGKLDELQNTIGDVPIKQIICKTVIDGDQNELLGVLDAIGSANQETLARSLAAALPPSKRYVHRRLILAR